MTKLGLTSGAPPRATPILARGATVGGVIAGKYRIQRVIGHGGMGVVVAASHLQLERTVAIKLIRGDWADDPLAVERLVREAKALASIQSEHVARVLDVGTLDDGIPFIVMEYLEGRDLATLLERDGPLPIADAVDYLLQACEALAEAHRNGIVHRDIKPANLFVARQPGGGASIKVVDFGISKLINSASVESLTHPSRIVGSLYHMAPEQMRGEAVDARTDVWALGVLLFELITGRKPFPDASWPAVCARVLNESAPPLGSLGDHVPEELAAGVRRCLSRAPEDRYGNVAELAVALSPFGNRGARSSLERIVRLATSTGSLAAEARSPLPPRASGVGLLSPSVVHEPAVDPGSQREESREIPSSRSREEGQPDRVGGTSRWPSTGAPGLAPGTEPPLRAVGAARRRERRWVAVGAAAALASLPWLWLRPRGTDANAGLAQVALRQRPAPTKTMPAPAQPASALPAAGAPSTEPAGAARGAPAPVAPAPAESRVQRRDREPAVAPAAPPATSPAAPRPVPSAGVPAAAALPKSPSELETVAPAPPPAVSEAVPASAAAQPPAAAAPAPPRGANPWDLRDLEFE